MKKALVTILSIVLLFMTVFGLYGIINNIRKDNHLAWLFAVMFVVGLVGMAIYGYCLIHFKKK